MPRKSRTLKVQWTTLVPLVDNIRNFRNSMGQTVQETAHTKHLDVNS